MATCTRRPEPDTAPASADEASDAGQLWGGLIAYELSYTTSARKKSSGASPSGDAPRKQISAKQPVMGRSPPVRRRKRWTPERRNYETRAVSGSWAGPDVAWVGSDLARRFGWHVAEQAALEVDRVVRYGRYRTAEASPPISPAASPDHNYAAAGTKVPAATCASTSTGPDDSTKTSIPEPHTATTVPRPDRHQPRTRLPDPGGRFRSPLQNHGSSTTNSSKRP